MNAGVKTNILNDITRDELNTSVGSNTDIQTGKGREGKGKDFKERGREGEGKRMEERGMKKKET